LVAALLRFGPIDTTDTKSIPLAQVAAAYLDRWALSRTRGCYDGRATGVQRRDEAVRELKAKKPEYGNWVSAKLIYIPGAFTLVFLGFSVVLPVLLIGAVLFFLPFVYFAYARHRFSRRGGDIQARIQDLLLDYLDWDGERKVLDIGCGNAPLTIKIARKYPDAEVTGVDY